MTPDDLRAAAPARLSLRNRRSRASRWRRVLAAGTAMIVLGSSSPGAKMSRPRTVSASSQTPLRSGGAAVAKTPAVVPPFARGIPPRVEQSAAQAAVQVHGAPRVNVALAANGAIASASSTADVRSRPAGATDGDRIGRTTGWKDATRDAFPDWLEVDFKGAKAIDEIDVFTGQDGAVAVAPTPATIFQAAGITDFEVDYWTGSNWQAVPGGVISGNNLVWRRLAFPVLRTSKIRVVVTGALGGFSRIAELEAWGSAVDEPPTVTLTAPVDGTLLTAPASIALTAAATDPGGPLGKVDFFANGQLIGTSPAAPYTIAWPDVPAGSYWLSAVATGHSGLTATSAPVSMTVNPPGTRTNVALAAGGATAAASSTLDAGYSPRGAIDGDRSGRAWGIGGGWSDATADTFPDWLEVDFSDAKTIEEIDVFTLQDDFAAPVEPTPALTFTANGISDFQVQYWTGADWQTIPGGIVAGSSLVWQQIAFPALTTSKIRVLVGGAFGSFSRITELEAWSNAAGNVPPTVTLTAPANGATFTSPATIAVAASASDADSPIAQVDFFANGQPIGTATAEPYAITWPNVTAGTYTLTASARDSLGASSMSAPVGITIARQAPPTGRTTSEQVGIEASSSATFVGADTVRQGSWKNMYGADGHTIVDHSTIAPSYGSAVPSGQDHFTWAGATVDVRGLQMETGTNRIASTWFGDDFSIDVALTDTSVHRVALYVLDWDTTARGETIEVHDAATDALLDTRSVTGFNGGQYLIWNVQGHVRFRVIRTAGLNAVVSGIFFDTLGGGVNPPPTVTLTNPPNNATYTAPASIPLSATASDSDGIAKVEFYAGSQLIATSTTVPYSATWNNVSAGTYLLTAKAYDTQTAATVSSSVSVTVNPASGGTTATFVTADTTTQGSWRNVYGVDGHTIVDHSTVGPSYGAAAKDSQTGTFTWAGATTDVRALQMETGTNRIASTWFGDPFAIDVALADGAAHRIALYMVDWDSTTRAQTIEVRDAATAALLDTRAVSSFHNGVYLVWNVQGHVTFNLIRTGTLNAVVSGVFFDTPSGGVNPPPTVALTTPAVNAVFAAPATIQLAATASDSNGIDRVEFYAGTQLIATDTTAPYSATWSNVAAGSYLLTAKAYDTLNASTVSSPVPVTVTAISGGPTATFVTADTTTQGSWRNVYGADGRRIVDHSIIAPPYGAAPNTPALSYTWAGATTDVRALQMETGTDRIASTWYADPSFVIDVALTDAAVHRIALYMVDWDSTTRSQTIEVRDGVTDVLLDSRSVSNFHNGEYLVWNIQGHVKFKAIRTGTLNAVVSGVFFDPAGSAAPTVTLTSPVPNASYIAPATIPLSATASDSDGIQKVEFYAGSTLLATATTAPYNGIWNNVAVGAYSVTAKAYDNLGASTLSTPVPVTVTTPNTPPAVALTAPAVNATFVAPATIAISANATDTDGIKRVDFYANGLSIGNDSTSPYGMTWTNVAAGSYTLTAVATDMLDVTNTSAPVPITVTACTGGCTPTPTITNLSPSSGSIGTSVTITGTNFGSGVAPTQPPIAPTAANAPGAGLGLGTYKYAYTNVTTAGESSPSPLAVITTDQLATPTTIPGLIHNGPNSGCVQMTPGTIVDYAYSYGLVNNDTSQAAETALSPVLSDQRNQTSGTCQYNGGPASSFTTVDVFYSPDARVKRVRVYRRLNNGPWVLLAVYVNFSNQTVLEFDDFQGSGITGVAAPTSNTAYWQQTNLTNIVPGPSGTTARRIYRTAVNGTQLKLVATLQDNVATGFLDAFADANLGGTPPTTTPGPSTVTFNGVAAAPVSWSATSIVAVVPNAASDGPVVITVNGQASNGMTFTVTPCSGVCPGSAPTITALLPPSGPVGTSVTISGSNLGLSPLTATPSAGTGLTAGSYSYVYTNVVGNVESFPSPTASVGVGAIANPTAIPDLEFDGPNGYCVSMTTGVSVDYAYTWSIIADDFDQSAETLLSPARNNIRQPSTQPTSSCSYNGGITASAVGLHIPNSTDPRVKRLRVYRRINSGPWSAIAVFVNNIVVPYTLLIDTAPESYSNVSPAGSTLNLSRVSINGIAIGPLGTTARNVYRTAVNGTQLKLLTTLANNSATTFIDAAADSSLGAAIPVAPGTRTVTFNGVTAAPTSWTPNAIVAPVPSGTTTGPVVVTVNGQASNGVTFTVSTTPPPSCTFSLTPQSSPFSASGGSGSFAITASSSSCAWDASTQATFVHITSSSNGTGSTTVTFAVDANSTTNARNGIIVVNGNLTFTVVQAAASGGCAFSLSPSSAAASMDGGNGSIGVSTSSSCAWTALAADPWIVVTSGAAGTGSGTVGYSVQPNTTQVSRSSSINVAGIAFPITQTGTCSIPAAPTFTPPGGSYAGNTASVTLSVSDVSATIRYTLDGTDPTSTSTTYSTPIVVNTTRTIRARAFTSCGQSAIASATYFLNATQQPPPTVSPAAGSYDIGQSVTMTAPDIFATIRYTLDGTDPTATSPAYSTPIVLNASTTVKAQAYRDSFAPSTVVTAQYDIRVPTPTLDQPAGTYDSNPVFVFVHDTMQDATLRYTLDGYDPTPSSPIVSNGSAVTVPSDDTTLKVRAFKNGYAASQVMTATYFFSAAPALIEGSSVEVTIDAAVSQGFNPIGGSVTFHLSNGTVDPGQPLSATVNGDSVPPGHVYVSSLGNDVQVAGLQDGQNFVTFNGTDADGSAVTASGWMWGGSRALTLTVQDTSSNAIAGALVTAIVTDDRSVGAAQYTNSSGTVTFLNLPTTEAIELWVEATGYRTKTSVAASGSSFASFQLDVDNNDFSQGLTGWSGDPALVYTVSHSEASLPPVACPACLPRNTVVTGAGAPDESEVGAASVNLDMVVNNQNSLFAVRAVRFFETSPGTREVTIRYRFQTVEPRMPNPQNDTFFIQLSSNESGLRNVVETVSSLGGQLDGNGASGWRILTLPIVGNTQTVRIEATVTNAFDAAGSSWIYVDNITERSYQFLDTDLQGRPTFLLDVRDSNDPQQAIRPPQKLKYLSMSTHQAFSGNTRVYGRLTVSGDDDDWIQSLFLDVKSNGSVLSFELASSARPLLYRAFTNGIVSTTDETTLLFEIPSSQLNALAGGDKFVELILRGRTFRGHDIRPLPMGEVRKWVWYTGTNRFGEDANHNPSRDLGLCEGLSPTATKISRTTGQRVPAPELYPPFLCGGDSWTFPRVRDFIATVPTWVSWNDFSKMNGEIFPPHNTHKEGLDIDGFYAGYKDRDGKVADKMLELMYTYGYAIEKILVYNPRQEFKDKIIAAGWMPDGRKAIEYFSYTVPGHDKHFHWQLKSWFMK